MNRDRLQELLAWLEEEENQDALRLLVREAMYVRRHARIRTAEGEIRFGLEDPCTVGQILGILSLFYPLTGGKLVVQPVFDENLFEGNIRIEGHVRFVHFAAAGIRLFMNRPIRKLVLRLMKER